MRDVYLNAIASEIGARTETNDAATLGCAEEQVARIVKKTGVQRRPIAADDQLTSDLARGAVERLFAATGVAAGDVGALVVCTQTPDHLIPGVSSLLHGQLKLRQDCFVLDINQGCSGFIVGAQMMSGLINAGVDNAVLVNADVYSRLIRADDFTTRSLFGDGAAASLYSTHAQGLKLLSATSFADGSGYDAFVARSSAIARDADVSPGIHMDGPAILNFALRAVPDAISQAMHAAAMKLADVRMVLFHQANRFVVGQLIRKLALSDEQAPQNCEHLGNTVSASIPLLLAEVWPTLHAGDRVLAVGFGVGLSWGTALFEVRG